MPELNAASMRDELHEIPELGFEEFKTSDYVADKLQKLGIEFVRGVGGTGVLGIIRGAEPGPVMLLRADMDALPFKNADGSIERVHACGHDGHTAMLLAAASRLVGKIRRGKKSLVRASDDRAVLGGDDGRDTIIVRPARCLAENLRSEYLFHMLYYNIYLFDSVKARNIIIQIKNFIYAIRCF